MRRAHLRWQRDRRTVIVVQAGERQEASFGQLLRELRTAAVWTQEKLAEEAGLSPRGISDLERGERRSPRLGTVRRIATALRLAAGDRTALESAARPLQDRYRLLAWGAPDAPARHQTLLAAVDWSYALLSDSERLLFDRLSVFRGGCSLEAAEAVCAGGGLQSEDVLDILPALVDKSLVVATLAGDGSVRYSQLETLREYARGRLAARGETDVEAVRARHLAHFVRVAEQAEPGLRGALEVAWLDRLERDHDNVRSALEWAAGRDGSVEQGLRLAGGVWRFWMMRGHVVEGRRWLAGLLARTAPLPPGVRAKGLDAAGVLAFQNADYDCALALHEEALALLRQPDDAQDLAAVLSHLGSLASVRGEPARARALFQESLAASRSVGDRAGVAGVLVNLAIAARAQAELDEAHAFLEQALDLFRSLKSRAPQANALHCLGNIAHDRGQLPESRTYYQDALALAEQVQDWGCVARCIESLAAVNGKNGRPARSAELYGAVEARREDIGIPITGPRRDRHDAFIDYLERMLGPAALAAAWKRGRGLSRERAVKLALAR